MIEEILYDNSTSSKIQKNSNIEFVQRVFEHFRRRSLRRSKKYEVNSSFSNDLLKISIDQEV